MLTSALIESVRTGEKAVFRSACREFAARAIREGIEASECVDTLDAFGDLSVLALAADDPSRSWTLTLYDHVTMTVQFGIDEVRDTFEDVA